MNTRRTLVVGLIALAMIAAACGGDDDGGAIATTTSRDGDGGEARTVEVDMVDIAFEPDSLEVAEGETVRFVFTNKGSVAHDAFIGDSDAQAEHEEEMRGADAGGDDMGGMGGMGGGDDGITVEKDKTGELTYTFDEAGTVEIGCHQPGHYDTGMKIEITVS